MMKRLLFTSAIALFSVVTFGQNSNYSVQRSGKMDAQRGGYQGSGNTTPKSSTQPVTQPPTSYPQSSGSYNNAPQTNNNTYSNSGNNQGGKYQPTQQQPINNYNQGRDYGYGQVPQNQPQHQEFGHYGNDRKYIPVFHQPSYRRDYRYEEHRGHDRFDQHGYYWY